MFLFLLIQEYPLERVVILTKGLKYLVLDEADRMLDMGFSDDIAKIITYLPADRQNLLFSATMPPKMRDLARKLMEDPVEVNIAVSKPPEAIVQEAFVVYEKQKSIYRCA